MKKKGKEMQKWEYLKNKKSGLGKRENIFHNYLSAIIEEKNEKSRHQL